MTKHEHDTDYRPCDTRYRTSKHFLDDQLQCSGAVSDFRAMKEAIGLLAFFGGEPALAPIHITETPR